MGSCHYLEGNLRAKRRVQYAKDVLDKVGVGGNRLEMFNMSSAEGKKWAEICTGMTARIKELGPSPVRGKAVNVVDEAVEASS